MPDSPCTYKTFYFSFWLFNVAQLILNMGIKPKREKKKWLWNIFHHYLYINIKWIWCFGGMTITLQMDVRLEKYTFAQFNVRFHVKYTCFPSFIQI